MTVIHTAYAPCTVPVQVGAGSDSTTVALRKGGKLRIRVRDRKGKPIEGAEVHVLSEEGGTSGEDLVLYLEELGYPIVTQIDGYLVLAETPPGTYRVSAKKGDAASREERVVVSAGRTAEVPLTIAE